MKKFVKSREMGLVILLAILMVIISVKNPAFIRPSNILNILKTNVILAIVSLGMLVVMITGGIDTSVGAIISTATLVTGNIMVRITGNIWIAFLAGAVTGIFIGILNGLLIAYIQIPPIVVTLGMYSIVSGTALYITKGAYINNLPDTFTDFGRITFLNIFPDGNGGKMGIPIQLVFLAALIGLTYFILHFTKIGRGIFAVGGNRMSAERIGFNVNKITVFVYGYMGFICGIAGVVHTSIMRQVDPNAFVGYDMQTIAAVILGGVNVMGGEGTITGTLLGVALFAVINNGLTLMKISTYWQSIILGALMVVSICFVVIRKNQSEKRQIKVEIDQEVTK